METTTTHEAAIAHDEELLRLLAVYNSALSAARAAEQAVISSAAIGYSNHQRRLSLNDSPLRSIAFEDFPMLGIYQQAKTFTLGEAGYYVRTPEGPRRATVKHARGAASEASLEAFNTAADAVSKVYDEVVAHEENYTGWARYFLVTSSAGHVHSSMACPTCNGRTTYAPVVALSESSEAEAVEMLGETLCTVCFPSAPVSGRPGKITKAAAAKLVA
jgi:hypothetical protein